jgi:2-C-methyl-D-erythritol 4-phosphate cytidylyltransferase
MKVFVIIPAAGLGTRMTSATSARSRKKSPSKQFTQIAGVPILIRTLRKFSACPEVEKIYVALRSDEIDNFCARLEKEGKDILQKPVQLVEGGEHRQNSVEKALAAIHAAPDDVILVHDAVRPFVTPQVIQDVIAAAQKHGAAIAGMPAIDTVKQVERTAEGAVITATVPRERVVMAQTPQGFRYGLLRKVFDEAAADGFVGTDEASLVERSGQEVVVVMGSPQNIKITTPADLELAEFFLKGMAS